MRPPDRHPAEQKAQALLPWGAWAEGQDEARGRGFFWFISFGGLGWAGGEAWFFLPGCFWSNHQPLQAMGSTKHQLALPAIISSPYLFTSHPRRKSPAAVMGVCMVHDFTHAWYVPSINNSMRICTNEEDRQAPIIPLCLVKDVRRSNRSPAVE